MNKLKLNPNATKQLLKENNFREINSNYFSYKFPAYKYENDKKRTLLYCILYVDFENNTIDKEVINDNGTPYATYNNTTGTSFIKKINKTISNELKKLRMLEIVQ